jgi:3-oxoacyl-[acyl-carrier protein] reductase
MQNLKNKVALVSGSGRGIGRAIALKLARHGAKVVVNDADEEPGRAVAEEIKSAGGEAVAVNGSVTDQGFPDRFVGAAMETFGGLDVIVNNAGYTWDSTIQKMTDEQFQAMLDVHLVAPFRILRAAAEPIRAMAKREAQPVKRCSGRSSTFRPSPVFTATQAKPVIPPPKPRSSGSHARCARNGDATRST